MHQPASQVMEELTACIACGECLAVCPALSEPIPIETLNRETLYGATTERVARFARACYQCGACVPVCPVGLHSDSMMMWLKVRLLLGTHAPTHSHESNAANQPAISMRPRLVALQRGRHGD